MLLCALVCLVVIQSHGKAGTNGAPQGALRKSGRGWAAGVSSLLLEDPLSVLTLIFGIARFRFCSGLSFSEQESHGMHDIVNNLGMQDVDCPLCHFTLFLVTLCHTQLRFGVEGPLCEVQYVKLVACMPGLRVAWLAPEPTWSNSLCGSPPDSIMYHQVLWDDISIYIRIDTTIYSSYQQSWSANISRKRRRRIRIIRTRTRTIMMTTMMMMLKKEEEEGRGQAWTAPARTLQLFIPILLPRGTWQARKGSGFSQRAKWPAEARYRDAGSSMVNPREAVKSCWCWRLGEVMHLII